MRESLTIIALCLLAVAGCIDLPGGEVAGGAEEPSPDGEIELCNGLDDDLDGLVDEGLKPPPADNQTGPCAGNTKACAGTQGWVEPVLAPGAVDADCDALDDDCDGEVDEDYPVTPTRCAVGACDTEGELRCIGGVPTDTCIIGALGLPERLCDAVDNDCDGVVDETDDPGECCGPADLGPPCNGCPDLTFVPAGYVCAPAGVFTMGTDGPILGGTPREDPIHQVEISKPLLVSIVELTRLEWSNIYPTDPSSHPPDMYRPVETITWYDALAYGNALSTLQGFGECYLLDGCRNAPGEEYVCNSVAFLGVHCDGYRLPTEAEWEHFTRAGTTTAYSSGDDDESLASVGWYLDTVESLISNPVMGLAPNPWGLFDVHGNVFEWVYDGARTYSAEAQSDPVGPDDLNRVVRGGCYQSIPRYTQSAFRFALSSTVGHPRVGVRLVRSLGAP